jgi:hypothetical protein
MPKDSGQQISWATGVAVPASDCILVRSGHSGAFTRTHRLGAEDSDNTVDTLNSVSGSTGKMPLKSQQLHSDKPSIALNSVKAYLNNLFIKP